MKINDPDVVAAVREVFDRYEAALLANDTETLDALFLHRGDTVRYGVAETQRGIEAIRAFRATQRPFERRLENVVVVTYGQDVATASALFYRPDYPGEVGRQQQTWIRTESGWVIAAAHVSMMPASKL